MERVLGIGGDFLRAAEPQTLRDWCRDCPGLGADDQIDDQIDDQGVSTPEPGPTVFATFEADSDYLGARDRRTVLNFRVRDLDAMPAQLRERGTDVADEVQDVEGVGRFGWVTDPEGNRVELWQVT